MSRDQERDVTATDLASAKKRRSGRLGRRGFATVVMTAVVLSLLGTVAYAAMLPTRDGARDQFKAAGRVKIKNSLGRDPILGMQGMAPGDRVSGTVNIGNASKKLRANFFVGLSKLVETPGTGGGRLSDRLVLTVERISKKRRPQRIYRGPLRQMPLVKLGKYRAKETRSYRFTVSFPNDATAYSSRYYNGAVSLQFTWYARKAR
jgi:hypothetical protein